MKITKARILSAPSPDGCGMDSCTFCLACFSGSPTYEIWKFNERGQNYDDVLRMYCLLMLEARRG